MTDFPDPRPTVVLTDTGPLVAGWRCTACARPLALGGPWCPWCRGKLEPATFGPGGDVWSATVLRVPLPGRPPPSALAYVDLDDGPRMLGHVTGAVGERLHAGARVELAGVGEAGDLLFEEVDQ
jgi:uncharacterized OB-fold protein